MGRIIGVSQKANKEAGGEFAEAINLSKLDPGRYAFRLVEGVKRQEQIWWPTVREDATTGILEDSFAVLTVDPSSKNVLDMIAGLDRRIQIEQGRDPKNVRSALDRAKKWVYLGFDRREAEPILREIHAPWTVFSQLRGLQEEVDPSDPSLLLNGLIFMYDVLITISQDPRKKGWKGRSYRVDPYGNKFEGTIPTTWLKDPPKDFSTEAWLLENEIFTEEEMGALDESPLDLGGIATPVLESEIFEALAETPINFGAVRDDGSGSLVPVFSKPQRLIELADEKGAKYIEDLVEREALPEPKTLEKKEVAEPRPKERDLKEEVRRRAEQMEKKLEKRSSGEDEEELVPF